MLDVVRHEINLTQREFGVGNESGSFTGPYWIVVFAADVLGVVSCAGGWLYDQAARGLRVTAAVADSGDPRPLQILGLDVVDLASALASSECPRAYLLGVDSEHLASKPRARELLLRKLSKTGSEIAMWGGQLPPGLGHLQRRAQHILSPPARAFKQQALLAAAPEYVVAGLAEEFWCGLEIAE